MFHPEASRVAQTASGGRKSLAQSIFQVGGNGGSAIGPLLAALILIPYGQHAVMVRRSRTARRHAARKDRILVQPEAKPDAVVRPHKPYHILQLAGNHRAQGIGHPGRHDFLEILLHFVHDQLLHVLPHREIRHHGTGIAVQPVRLPCRIGRRHAVGRLPRRPLRAEICHTFLHPRAAPFTLALPYLNLYWTIAMAIIVGLVIASAFSAILVYATDLKPDKVA